MAPETLAPGRTEQLNPKKQARLRVRQLTLESTAQTVQGISDDVQQKVEEDITKGAATDMHAEEERSFAQGFEKAIQKADIGKFQATKTDANIKAFAQQGGSDSQVTFNTVNLAELVDGGDQAVDDAELTRHHELRHVRQRNDVHGTIIVRGAKVDDYKRAEGDAETASEEETGKDESTVRGDAPRKYRAAQQDFLVLKGAVRGDAEGESLFRGVMFKDAPKAEVSQLQEHIWARALKNGELDPGSIEQEAAQNGMQHVAQRVIARHRFRQALNPSMN